MHLSTPDPLALSASASSQPQATVTPLGRLRWGLVALLLLAAVVNYLDRATLSIANTTIAAEFGFSQTQMGLLMSAFLWPYALANLPAGWLVDRLGPRRMFAWALGLWSTCTAMVAFANGFAYLYGLRMLLGIAESPFFASSIKITNRWFGEQERGLPTALVNTGSQLANALAPPLLTVLLLLLGWRGMFFAIGLLGLPLLLAWWAFYRDPEARELARLHGETLADARAMATPLSWGALFRHRTTWAMILGNCSLMFTIWVYLTWLPSYLEKSLGFSLRATGWIAAIPFCAGILGVLAGGLLSDRLVRRGLNAITARKVPIVLGATLAACCVAPISFAEHPATAITLLTLGYFCSQLPQGAIWTLAGDIAPRSHVASLGAIQNFGGFLGAALAPVVTGLVLDATGRFTGVFLLGACLLALGALSYGLGVRQRITGLAVRQP